MSTKSKIIEWTPEKVRISFSLIDDTPEVPEDDPTYPVNKGTIWGTTVELDARAFAAPQGDLQALVNVKSAELDAVDQAAEARAQEIRSKAGLPPATSEIRLVVSLWSVSKTEDEVLHGYTALVETYGPPGVDVNDLEVRDCTDDYSTVHGTESFSSDGAASLRDDRLQSVPVDGWNMELWDKKNSKSLHRWVMPNETYTVELLA